MVSSLPALLALTLLAVALGAVRLFLAGEVKLRAVVVEPRPKAPRENGTSIGDPADNPVDTPGDNAAAGPWAADGPYDGGAAAEVPVYVAEKFRNPALSIFRTGILGRYGSGRLTFRLVDHSHFECHNECLKTGQALLANRTVVGEAGSSSEYCLATGRERECKLKHLRCNYPNCATLVTNNERCTAPAAYDAREYYTTDLPDKGYLPLGPRSDAWASFEKMAHRSEGAPTGPAFEVKKASERRYAFNAVFSQSTSAGRRKLAALIQDTEGTNSSELEVFATMAKKWNANVNSAKTKQLNTDEYARVVFDSAFTLAPAGHNSECFRLYEAVEAGSIPILVQSDLHRTKPCRHSLVHWFDAPIVVLRKWEELYPTVTKLMENRTALDGRQAELRTWHEGFMKERVRAFEDFVINGKKKVPSNTAEKEAKAGTDAIEEEAAKQIDATEEGEAEEEATTLTDTGAGKNEPVGTNDTTALDRGETDPREQNDPVDEEPKEPARINNTTVLGQGTTESIKQNDNVVDEAKGRARFILGHSTGHAGSTAVQRALSKGGCPWETVAAFEKIPSAAKAYDYGSPTMEKYVPEDVEALQASCRPTLASFRRRLPEDANGDLAYLDMGHFHNRGRVLECLAAELKGDVTFVRMRRARYDIARSFAADLQTPCTGSNWIGMGKKVKRIGNPRVALCPRSSETGGLVNLPVPDEAWDSLTAFQKFLWYADEMESRWQSLRASFAGPQYLEITWSNSSELEVGVGAVRNALGCSATDVVKNKKTHVKHIAGSLNCTELIRQDWDYRLKMQYDDARSKELFSEYRSAYHGNIDDCMETEPELRTLEAFVWEATPEEANNKTIAADRAENETLAVVADQSPTAELMQQLCTQQSLSLEEYSPGKVNSVRRALAAEIPSCYEQHFSAFAEYTRARLNKKKRHLSLHIPKAGGSSLCELVKSSTHLQTPKGTNNCWERKHGFPLWGLGSFKDRREWTIGCNETSHCDEFDDASVPSFAMNENYLDHPLLDSIRLYSVTLREPVDRAMSQERHLAKFARAKANKKVLSQSTNATAYDARVALARNNYMTWALAAGKTPFGYRQRVLLSPRREHLEIAKETLAQFDFLLELSQNSTCERATLRLMGMGGEGMGRAREGVGSKPGMSDRDMYASWNSLDIELHRYARQLIELDCEFFLRLEKSVDVVQKETREVIQE